MKKLFLLFALLSAVCTQMNAQIIKGDMNDDHLLDVADINELISTVLGRQAEQYVNDSFAANAIVAGTWYENPNKMFSLLANGSTNYPNAVRFKYIPNNRCIVFIDKRGMISEILNLVSLQDGVMVVNPFGTDEQKKYTSQPIQYVTSITISPSTLRMTIGEQKSLTATVSPADATNKKVTWTVDKPEVARLVNNVVYAVSSGEAIITCSATDDSGVKATCKVEVDVKHEYVDLGLPGGVLWATCNIGADKPEATGKYFAWGEKTGYAKYEGHTFSWTNYDLCNGSSTTMTKYCGNPNYGKCDNITELVAADDAATVNWGSGWRMPTYQEICDLYNPKYTTSEWVTVNGVKCRKVTSKSNNKYIILPATGYINGTELINESSHGYYWTRTLFQYAHSAAYYLDVTSGYMEWNGNERFYGQCIRPVRVTP